MFIGLGTAINVAAIVLGSFIGVVMGNRLKESTRFLMTDVLGSVTLLGAASAAMKLWDEEFTNALPQGTPILVILLSLLLGGLVGSAIQIEEGLERWGLSLQSKLDRGKSSTFVEGFVTSSLVFAIGPLAILGSLSDGMGTGIDQLTLKSILDFFASIAFAGALGWGVAFSALPVGIYQGAWTLIGLSLGSILSGYQVAAMTATGSILLFGIALNLLKVKKIAIGNLLPALAIAPLMALLFQAF